MNSIESDPRPAICRGWFYALPALVLTVAVVCVAGCGGKEAIAPVERSNAVAAIDEATPFDLESIATVKREGDAVTQVDFRNRQYNIDDIEQLSSHPAIKVVRFGGDSETRIDDDTMIIVGRLPKLKVLAIDNQNVTAAGLQSIANPAQIVELYAANTSIDDAVAGSIAAMTNLRKVRLAGTQIGAETLAALAQLPELTTIDISGCPGVTDDAIKPLANAAKLQSLNVYDTPLSADAASTFSKVATLTSLNVDKTGFDDASASKITALPLTFLHLGSTRVTDAAAEALVKIETLERLIVTRTGMTQAGVDVIAAANPDCEIQLQYVPPAR